MWISRSGFAKRASTWEACSVRGVRARFFTGRFERGSADVGIASGIGSDMVFAGEDGYAWRRRRCVEIRAPENTHVADSLTRLRRDEMQRCDGWFRQSAERGSVVEILSNIDASRDGALGAWLRRARSATCACEVAAILGLAAPHETRNIAYFSAPLHRICSCLKHIQAEHFPLHAHHSQNLQVLTPEHPTPIWGNPA